MIGSAFIWLCALSVQSFARANLESKGFMDSFPLTSQRQSGLEGHHSVFRRDVSSDAVCCDLCTEQYNPNYCEEPDTKNTFQITYDGNTKYTAFCYGITPESSEWPTLVSETTFDLVQLNGCPPPSQGSYVSHLKRSKISAKELQLLDLPPNSKITADTFDQVPEVVTVSAVNKIKPVDGAINRMKNVKNLNINNIDLTTVSDKLPANLNNLFLMNTGVTSLSDEALAVTTLKINEESLQYLDGSAPRLSALILYSPVRRLPQAPKLKAIWFKGAATTYLSELNLAVYPLETINVFGSIRTFPKNFLKNQTKLKFFDAQGNGLTKLADDLFRETPKLYYLDLSHNNLEYLPYNLLNGLHELSLLRLDNNQLHLDDIIGGVPVLDGMRQLRLQNNPIRDWCMEGTKSHLAKYDVSKLEVLDLSGTQLTEICSDWLQMPNLRKLILNNNQLTSISCYRLRFPRQLPLKLELKYNSILDCDPCISLPISPLVTLEMDC